ncbi:unnamed protein product [Closterium sp. Naga37s-1]|nr:unnamed protein product [Closterium sp. Naga37s-1]
MSTDLRFKGCSTHPALVPCTVGLSVRGEPKKPFRLAPAARARPLCLCIPRYGPTLFATVFAQILRTQCISNSLTLSRQRLASSANHNRGIGGNGNGASKLGTNEPSL